MISLALILVRRSPTLFLMGLLAAAVIAAQTAPSHPAAAMPAQPPPAPPANTTQAVIEPVSHIRPPGPGHRLANGETLIYDVDWRLWSAGTAVLRLDAANSEQRVTASADSIGVVSLLYTVRDRFEAHFDPQTFCSLRIAKHTEEGFRRLDTSVRFDYTHRKSVLEEKNLKTGQGKRVENDIPACVTDVISAIYYVGSLPLQPGATYTFPLNDGGKTVDVKAHVEAREEIKTTAGTFQTIRVQPEAASGVVKERGRVWLWYSDDDARIPVQMRARMFWGTLTFRLQRVERR